MTTDNPENESKQQEQPPAELPSQAELTDQETQLELLKAERDDLLARLQRVSADYLNYQKRIQRDIEHAREFANEALIRSLLTVLDDMERALEVARQNHDENDPLLKGMELVHKKALDTFGRFGLTVIEAQGKPFDPSRHSALMQQETREHPPLTVLQELQKGYQLKGRTIRPASVVVSKSPEAPQDQGEGD